MSIDLMGRCRGANTADQLYLHHLHLILISISSARPLLSTPPVPPFRSFDYVRFFGNSLITCQHHQ